MPSMNKNELVRRLMATFLEELQEHVETLNRGLLKLEKEPQADGRDETLKTIFRAAHSMKGAARAVNVDLIEKACHELEDILQAACTGKTSFSAELFGVLFSAADALEEAGMRLREEHSLEDSPLSRLLVRLERARHGEFLPAEPVPPKPSPRAVAEDEQPPAPAADESAAEITAGAPEAARESRPTGPTEPVAAREPIPAPAADQTRAAGAAAPVAAAAPAAATVRVAASKLDTLLAQSGELLVARRRIASRIDDVTAIRDHVADWQARWRGVERPLRAVLQNDGQDPPARVPRRGRRAATGRPRDLGLGKTPRPVGRQHDRRQPPAGPGLRCAGGRSPLRPDAAVCRRLRRAGTRGARPGPHHRQGRGAGVGRYRRGSGSVGVGGRQRPAAAPGPQRHRSRPGNAGRTPGGRQAGTGDGHGPCRPARGWRRTDHCRRRTRLQLAPDPREGQAVRPAGPPG